MKEKLATLIDSESSSLKIDVQIAGSWLNTFLKKQDITIPITDQYSLHMLKIELGDGKVSVEADIKEKENSSIKLDCVPIWNTYDQQFFIQNIELKTDTKNLLIKSAGWIANTFMGTKLDKKIEGALNQMFIIKKQEFIAEGVPLPLPDGKGMVKVKSLFIDDMKFKKEGIAVMATLEGTLSLQLGETMIII